MWDRFSCNQFSNKQNKVVALQFSSTDFIIAAVHEPYADLGLSLDLHQQEKLMFSGGLELNKPKDHNSRFQFYFHEDSFKCSWLIGCCMSQGF